MIRPYDRNHRRYIERERREDSVFVLTPPPPAHSHFTSQIFFDGVFLGGRGDPIVMLILVSLSNKHMRSHL